MQARGWVLLRGLMVALLLLGGATTSLADVPSIFAQIYYGNGTGVHILGQELNLPTFELADETMTVDTATGDDGVGILFAGSGEAEATVTLDNANLNVIGLRANSLSLTGVFSDDFTITNVNLLGQSTITVKTTVTGVEENAVNYGIYAAGDMATVTLNEGSSVNAEATGEGAMNVGIMIEGAMATVTLNEGSSVSAEATGEAAMNYGIYAEGAMATVTLNEGSSAHAEATAEGAMNYGIYAAGAMATVTLNEGSSVHAEATGEGAKSAGIVTVGEMAKVTLSEGSAVSAKVTGEGAKSVGIYVSNNDSVEIALERSRISAIATSDVAGSISCGVLAEVATATINIDATSSITADWAVYGLCEQAALVLAVDNLPADVTVGNSGILSGRLLVQHLTNNAKGILEADLSNQAEFIDGDSSFTDYVYGGAADTAPLNYYFIAREATLAAGSIFRIKNPDNLGLTAVGY